MHTASTKHTVSHAGHAGRTTRSPDSHQSRVFLTGLEGRGHPRPLVAWPLHVSALQRFKESQSQSRKKNAFRGEKRLSAWAKLILDKKNIATVFLAVLRRSTTYQRCVVYCTEDALIRVDTRVIQRDTCISPWSAKVICIREMVTH